MLSACSWEETLLSSTEGSDFDTLLALSASWGGCRQPVWGDSRAGPVAWHVWGSCSGDAVRPARGVAKAQAASAVAEGALVAECCVMDGHSYTVPKVSFGSPYFCIFTLNLEPHFLPLPNSASQLGWVEDQLIDF